MNSVVDAIAVSISAMLVIASQTTPARVPAGADNLLPNASFERVTQNVPAGWESRAWLDSEENARWDVDPAGRTGQCVTIRSGSPDGADAAWTASISCKPNTLYRLSGWIRTKDVQGATGALLNIQNMQSVRTPALRGTRDWTRVSTLFRTGESPSRLEINCLFGGWGRSTGQAWYDDVAVEPVDPEESTGVTVTIDTDAEPRTYSPMIFGGFIEHFHHQVYGGLFDPGSPLSDENGFRKDVIEAMKELKLSVVRWPGGCFVSGYHWLASGASLSLHHAPAPLLPAAFAHRARQGRA